MQIPIPYPPTTLRREVSSATAAGGGGRPHRCLSRKAATSPAISPRCVKST